MGEGAKKEGFLNMKGLNQSFKTEVLAGLTTFISSVYIIITNALILSDAGLSQDGAMIATIFTCFISTLLMGVICNVPLIIVPGMGINSLFTYTIVNSMGLTPQQALGAVFVSGIIFTLIASSKLTQILMDSIPNNLKHSITIGVGFMIFLIGLQKSGIVVSNENTMVTLGDISNKETLLSIVTLFIILLLNLKKVNGSLLISIVIGTIISIFVGITDLNTLTSNSFNMSSFNEVFFAMNFDNMFSATFLTAVFSIVIVIVFENIGLLYGQLDALGKLDKFSNSFKVTGVSNILAGILGVSPTIVAAENFSGISVGAKGKISAITSSILFLLSLFLIPVLKLIPNAVVSAILIYIGIIMIELFFDLEKGDTVDNISMILIVSLIPFTYNIVNGISIGFITYTILNTFTDKKVSPTMYVLTFIFIINFILTISMGLSH